MVNGGGYMRCVVSFVRFWRSRLFPGKRRALLCALLALLAAFSLPGCGGGRTTVRAGKGTAAFGHAVIIDAGHGGVDGGAVGVDGVVEKGINLAISLKLKALFTASGYQVIMTREDDRSIHDEGSETIRRKKTTDIHNRFKIMEENPKALFLSIHQNKFGQSQYSGTQVFYSANNEISKVLAQSIQESVKAQLQPQNDRAIKPAGDNLYLLYHAKSPAVLVECGFLSNPTEAGLLQSDAYQNKMAFAIYCGVLGLYREEAPA